MNRHSDSKTKLRGAVIHERSSYPVVPNSIFLITGPECIACILVKWSVSLVLNTRCLVLKKSCTHFIDLKGIERSLNLQFQS